MTRALRAWLSWVLAAETATVKDSPARSDRAWIFEPGLPRSTGFGPVSPPPFLALAEAPSRTAGDQSMRPWLPSSSSTAWCIRRQSPASVYSVKVRCAVGAVTPNDGGRCRQAQPLVSTNTIAVNTARADPYGSAHHPADAVSRAESTAPPTPTTRRHEPLRQRIDHDPRSSQHHRARSKRDTRSTLGVASASNACLTELD